jgi:hypothetical protein
VVVRVQAYSDSSILPQFIIVSAVTVVGVGSVIFFKRKKVLGLLKNAKDEVLYYIEAKQLILMVVLCVIFLFTSLMVHFRAGRIEVLVDGYPTSTGVGYYGFPLEMMFFAYSTGGLPAQRSEDNPTFGEGFNVGTIVMWDRLLLNIAFYILLAFGLTYFGARLSEKFSKPEHEPEDFD